MPRLTVLALALASLAASASAQYYTTSYGGASFAGATTYRAPVSYAAAPSYSYGYSSVAPAYSYGYSSVAAPITTYTTPVTTYAAPTTYASTYATPYTYSSPVSYTSTYNPSYITAPTYTTPTYTYPTTTVTTPVVSTPAVTTPVVTTPTYTPVVYDPNQYINYNPAPVTNYPDYSNYNPVNLPITNQQGSSNVQWVFGGYSQCVKNRRVKTYNCLYITNPGTNKNPGQAECDTIAKPQVQQEYCATTNGVTYPTNTAPSTPQQSAGATTNTGSSNGSSSGQGIITTPTPDEMDQILSVANVGWVAPGTTTYYTAPTVYVPPAYVAPIVTAPVVVSSPTYYGGLSYVPYYGLEAEKSN